MNKSRYVDEYGKTIDSQCKRCKGNCSFEPMGGTWICYGFIPRTNFDKIKAMSIEELAKFLGVDFSCPNAELNKRCKEFKENCVKCWLEWLKQEAVDEHNS